MRLVVRSSELRERRDIFSLSIAYYISAGARLGSASSLRYDRRSLLRARVSAKPGSSSANKCIRKSYL